MNRLFLKRKQRKNLTESPPNDLAGFYFAAKTGNTSRVPTRVPGLLFLIPKKTPLQKEGGLRRGMRRGSHLWSTQPRNFISYSDFPCRPLALLLGSTLTTDHYLPMVGDDVGIVVGSPTDHQFMLAGHGCNNRPRLHHRLSDGFHELHLLCLDLLTVLLYYNWRIP